jgi:bud site selection protein 20
MGRSRKIGRAKQHQDKREIKVKNSRKRKDDDEVHSDLTNVKRRSELLNQAIDLDLPGKGQHYCLTCTKYYNDANTLSQHMKTKPHKRKLKMLKTEPYSIEEAERAAGMGSYKPPKVVDIMDQPDPIQDAMDADTERKE